VVRDIWDESKEVIQDAQVGCEDQQIVVPMYVKASIDQGSRNIKVHVPERDFKKIPISIIHNGVQVFSEGGQHSSDSLHVSESTSAGPIIIRCDS
jgi:hypothetical protein